MSKARELKAISAARGLRPVLFTNPPLAREGSAAVEVPATTTAERKPRAVSAIRPYRIDILLTAQAGALLEALRLHIRQPNGKPSKYPTVIEHALEALARARGLDEAGR